MTIEDAIRDVIRRFPFDGYMTPESAEKGAYSNIARTVMGYIPPGSKILDFGCGPCDKTAILQGLGYKCSAFDDLEDDWHKLPGNREKIMSFASDCGIDFKLADGRPFPFEKESFDLVMLNDVLEHLHDSPRDILNDLVQLAKPEGLVLITVPNAVNIRKRLDVVFGRTNLPRFDGFYWYPGNWRGHVREYVKGDLARLSEFLDLEILELRGCDHMLEKLPRRIVPAYLLTTTLFQGWKDSWIMVSRKKPGWTPRKRLSREELEHVLGKGTSYEYDN